MENVSGKKKGIVGLIILCVVIVLAAIGVITFLLLLPGIKYRSAMSKAQEYANEQDYKKAIAEYKKASAIKVSGNEAKEEMISAYLAWAKRQIRKEEYEDAIESCEAVLDIDEDNKRAKKLLDEAKEELAKASSNGGASSGDGGNGGASSGDGGNGGASSGNSGDGGNGGASSGNSGDSGNGGASSGNTGDARIGGLNTYDKITLRMWCNVPESDSRRHAYEAAIDEMSKMYPNVTIEWETFEAYAYKTRIKSAVAANEMPDIFCSAPCAFLGDFVDAGRVYCLDNAYLKYKVELPETMMQASAYNGKYYGVPYIFNSVVMFANMDVLKSIGYSKIPSTFEDLLECCATLKERGITPFGCAGDETWCVSENLESMFIKYMGADELNKIFLGRATWNNTEVSSVIETFQAMIGLGYFSDPNTRNYNDDVRTGFMNGEYAFYIGGTWNCAWLALDYDTNYSMAEFPVIDSNRSKKGEYIGGPSEVLSVAASCSHADAAADYAFLLAREICKVAYVDGCGLPAWKLSYDDASVNPLTIQAAELMFDASGFVLYGDTSMNEDDASCYLQELSKIYSSTINGKEFIERMAREIR